VLHRQIEDKTFFTVDLPLLIIREGTQREDVAPVRILKDLGIDYIGQCNFVVTFIQRKDDGWLRRGGSYGLDSEVYLCIPSGVVLNIFFRHGGAMAWRGWPSVFHSVKNMAPRCWVKSLNGFRDFPATTI
jgi:hypothetical protein